MGRLVYAVSSDGSHVTAAVKPRWVFNQLMLRSGVVSAMAFLAKPISGDPVRPFTTPPIKIQSAFSTPGSDKLEPG